MIIAGLRDLDEKDDQKRRDDGVLQKSQREGDSSRLRPAITIVESFAAAAKSR